LNDTDSPAKVERHWQRIGKNIASTRKAGIRFIEVNGMG